APPRLCALLPLFSKPVPATVTALPVSLLAIALIILPLSLGLLQHLTTVPDRAALGLRRWNIGNRAARLVGLAEQLVAHGVEEAAGLALFLRLPLFQLLDALGSAG